MAHTEIDTKPPLHVAIIMDGNGRWAEQRGKPRTFGHHEGARRVEEIVRYSSDIGIEALTLYAFSTENFRRPDYEVNVLLNLIGGYIDKKIDEIAEMNIRMRFIGDRARLPMQLQELMFAAEEVTENNTGMVLQVAVSYGGRAEISSAMRSAVAQARRGELHEDEVNEAFVSELLWTAGVPDPDLVVRTSGEKRISGFLLWQAAYAELAFVDDCWPDFTPERFAEVLADFAQRNRRFGGLQTVS